VNPLVLGRRPVESSTEPLRGPFLVLELLLGPGERLPPLAIARLIAVPGHRFASLPDAFLLPFQESKLFAEFLLELVTHAKLGPNLGFHHRSEWPVHLHCQSFLGPQSFPEFGHRPVLGLEVPPELCERPLLVSQLFPKFVGPPVLLGAGPTSVTESGERSILVAKLFPDLFEKPVSSLQSVPELLQRSILRLQPLLQPSEVPLARLEALSQSFHGRVDGGLCCLDVGIGSIPR